MTWILLFLGILEFLLPYILKWLQGNKELSEERGVVRELILSSRDMLNMLELAGLKNAAQRKRFAKVKVLYGKVQDAATKMGVQL